MSIIVDEIIEKLKVLNLLEAVQLIKKILWQYLTKYVKW